MTLRDRVARLEEDSAIAPSHDLVRIELERLRLLQKPELVADLDRRMTALAEREAEIQAKDAELSARHQQREDALEQKTQQLEDRENAIIKRETAHEVEHAARSKRIAEDEAKTKAALDEAGKKLAVINEKIKVLTA